MIAKLSLNLLVFLVLAPSAFAQIDASTLRAKYGSPLNRETFTLAPGIDLIADYGPNYQVCRMQLPGSAPKAQTDQILEELVPMAMRGREVGRFAAQSGIASVVSIEYENVTISETHSGSDRQGISVTFKNAGCATPGAP